MSIKVQLAPAFVDRKTPPPDVPAYRVNPVVLPLATDQAKHLTSLEVSPEFAAAHESPPSVDRYTPKFQYEA
jgi:hypothetical protein